jgi:transcriptional regulator with XRE-family HTH domain
MPARLPSARARRLGSDLRRARTAAGLSLEAAGAALGLSKTVLSRTETGRRNISAEEVAGLLAVYRVTGKARLRLMLLARSVGEPGWWDQDDSRLRPLVELLIDYEGEARAIVDVTPWLLPGLLQTPEFTRTWVTEAHPVPESKLEYIVAARRRRQLMLSRPGTQYTAFIGEAALKSRVGTVAAHRVQLNALVNASQRSNHTIRVVPDTTGPHNGQLVPYITYRMPDGSTVVHVELPNSGIFLDQPEQVSPFLSTIDKLGKVALSVPESVRFIRHVDESLNAVGAAGL